MLAVDGKTLRGSRHTDTAGVQAPGRHLLAVIDHHTRTVLGSGASAWTAGGGDDWFESVGPGAGAPPQPAAISARRGMNGRTVPL